jgi:hypothetical protein
MKTESINQDREEKIAELIRTYSKWDVDRKWLFTRNKDRDNVFKKSFHDINDSTKDADLSLWYLAFGQSFGKKTDVMHRKMAEMCTSADLALIAFKKDFPPGCPYSERKDEVIKSILAIDFTKPNKEITKEINECYRSEKFYHEAVWCNKDMFENCQYKDECPVHEWKGLINNNETALPFRTAPKIFFYYDSLCLLNNAAVSSFNELFSRIHALTDDSNKRTIVITALLKQIRGIATKTQMFLQWENIFNERDHDYAELIFVDLHAVRVAKNMQFPYYEDDLVGAIRKFGETYKLNARQIDFALWEMGFLCTDDGCLRDEEKLYLFSWDNVPGSESEGLIRFLEDDLGFDWVEAAEITKSDENKVIKIRNDKNRAHIVLDEKKEKATLTINNNSKNLELRVKRQNGKLNVYKSCIFYDVCPNANF